MRSRLTGPYSLAAARRATAVSLFFQWFIVVTGATVRLTGSGLGCSTWPTCSDTRALPELSFHPMVEFLNRITATPTLLAALVALWICWRLRDGARRDLRWSTALVVVGVLVQAGIGAFTVLLELPPEIVAAHFIVSIFLLTAATFAWSASGSRTQLRRMRGAFAPGAGAAMLLALLVVIAAGVLTTASGPHSGASGTGQVVDRFGIFTEAVTFHARAAYVFAGLLGALTFVRWRRTGRGPALVDLAVASVLVVVQITLGEVQYRNGLPWEIVLAHVVNAALLWIVASRAAIDAVFSRT